VAEQLNYSRFANNKVAVVVPKVNPLSLSTFTFVVVGYYFLSA